MVNDSSAPVNAIVDRSPFDAFYGLELLEVGPRWARGRLVVDERHLQPTGLVHGGVYCAIAEAVASHGTNWTVAESDAVGLGLSNSTNFLRGARRGEVLIAEAAAVHAGRTTWVWDVTIGSADGARTFAVSRVVVAVRPAQRG